MKPTKIQFAFYTKGYGENGKVKALVIVGRKQYVVNEVQCNVPCITRKRKNNPVFVVETIDSCLFEFHLHKTKMEVEVFEIKSTIQ